MHGMVRMCLTALMYTYKRTTMYLEFEFRVSFKQGFFAAYPSHSAGQYVALSAWNSTHSG
jgi:hypothetical protein